MSDFLLYLNLNFLSMQKDEIVNLLEEKHQNLFKWMGEQPVEKWMKAPKGKWTTGQHIAHLIESIKKVNRALNFPKFILKYRLGKANREVRDYHTVVQKYQTKLAKNQERAKKFNAHIKIPSLQERKKMLTTLQIQQKKLQHKTKIWQDKDLDNLILPHPLLGKMPVREMIMFIGYHTEHHFKILKENY